MSQGLHSISGFYKNDQPGGFGFQFRDDPEKLARLLGNIMDLVAELDGETEEYIISELDDCASKKDYLDAGGRAYAIALVILAESSGFIPSDEYNGYLEMSIQGETMVVESGSLPDFDKVLRDLQVN